MTEFYIKQINSILLVICMHHLFFYVGQSGINEIKGCHHTCSVVFKNMAIRLTFEISHICNSSMFTGLSLTCMLSLTRKFIPFFRLGPTENFIFLVATAFFDARGLIFLSVSGMKAMEGLFSPTRTVANFSRFALRKVTLL